MDDKQQPLTFKIHSGSNQMLEEIGKYHQGEGFPESSWDQGSEAGPGPGFSYHGKGDVFSKPLTEEELAGIRKTHPHPLMTIPPGMESMTYIPGATTIIECGCGFNASGPDHDGVMDLFRDHICYYPVQKPTNADVISSSIYKTARTWGLLLVIGLLGAEVLKAVLPLWTR